MSEASKAARSAMREKISRITRTDPKQKVDASGYTPPDALDADVKTGARPVRGRRYKSGGKVHGPVPKSHAGRKPRKSGGRALTADSLLNRDMVEANEERSGKKHVGAFKRGGRMMKHDDTAEDTKLIKKLVKPAAIKGHASDCRCAKCGGGRMGKKRGGSEPSYTMDDELDDHDPRDHDDYFGHEAGADMPRGPRSMPWPETTLSKKQSRKQMADIESMKRALPRGSVKQSPQVLRNLDLMEKGKLLPKAKGGRTGKAHGGLAMDGKYQGTRPTGGRLARKHGGKAGKMNVNIIIAGHHKGGEGMPPAGGMPPQGMPPRPPVMPVPIQALPPGMAAAGGGLPPLPPTGGPPMGGGMPPGASPMMRKSGGRVGHRGYRSYKNMDAGSGGGFGRLEKSEIQKHKG